MTCTHLNSFLPLSCTLEFKAFIFFSVYTWGWGVHGQLGHGLVEDCPLPTKLSALEGKMVTKITAGYSHSVVLTAKVREFISKECKCNINYKFDYSYCNYILMH